MMSRAARTVTTLLLCVVLLGAIAFAVISIPTASAVAEQITIDLDFDIFVPEVVQTRTTPMQVPVQSKVRQAGVLQTTGDAAGIEWTFELCRDGACRSMEPGTEVEPGDYALRVSAVLQPGAELGGGGSVAGQFQLVETESAMPVLRSATLLHTGIGMIGVILLSLAAQSRRRSRRRHGRDAGVPA